MAFWAYTSVKKVENINGEETTYGESDQGVVVMDVVEKSAAAEAGLQKDDIITALNGNSVKSIDELTKEIRQHQAGDAVQVSYLRDGKPYEVSATLQGREEEMGNAFYWMDEDQGDFDFDFDHDFDFHFEPCKPFIGVYLDLGAENEEGISVRRIIPDTPADEVNLESGDLIVAIDEVAVNSHGELVSERDKHQPGDEFTLTYLRNGQRNTVVATFPACEENDMPSHGKRKMIIIKKKKEESPTEETQENLNVSPEARGAGSPRIYAPAHQLPRLPQPYRRSGNPAL